MRWFLAEFLVVVAGILAALALNSWYQGRQDAATEKVYLQLLSRDLDDTARDLDVASAFEASQLKDGVFSYRSLFGVAVPVPAEAVSSALSRLGQRRTLLLKNATYQDLVSTGNIRLIRDRKLRDRIAAFYQTANLQFEILNKNNTTMVDDGFQRNVLLSGLVVNRLGSNHPMIAAADARLQGLLGADKVVRPDPLWGLAASDPQWAMVQSNLKLRLRLAMLSQLTDEHNAADARALKAEVDARVVR